MTPLIRNILYSVIGLAVGVFTVFMVVIAVTTANTAHSIRESQLANKSTFNLLQDCVEPGPTHKCYARGQQNQGQILNLVKIQQVATVACGDAPGTQSPEEINSCVDRTMAKLGVKR